jgi:galactokinase
MFAMIATAFLLSVEQSAAAPRPAASSYAETLRCSGLTQAASELEGGESSEGRALYDAALYWSLTTIQVGQTANRAAATVETEMTRARVQAVRELTARNEAALTALGECRTRTPSLG